MARKQYDVRTWADGSGRWHAVVTHRDGNGTDRGYRDAARRAIRAELLQREVGPSRPAHTVRVRVVRNYALGGPSQGIGFSEYVPGVPVTKP